MAMFNLPQAPIPISDTGIVGYRMVDLSTGLNPQNWTQNTHTFRFTVDGNTYWVPQRSYLRIRAKFRKSVKASNPTNFVPITRGDGIAPAFGFCATLFQSIAHDMSGTTVSQITSYVSQIDTLRHRIMKGQSWRDTMGPSINAYTDFHTRQNMILRDALSEEDTKFIHITKTQLIKNAPNDGSGITLASTFEVDVPAGRSFTGDEVIVTGGSGTLSAGTVVSKINLDEDGTWEAYSDILQVGDEMTVFVGGKQARSKVIAIVGQDLYLHPVIHEGALGPTTEFDFIIHHAIEKYHTVPTEEVEFLWSPPLSLWQDTAHGIPASIHELRLTPSQEWTNNCVETLGTLNALHQPHVEITDMKLFISVVDGPMAGSSDGKGQYCLNVSDWVCNAQQAPINTSGSLRLATYDVHASTTQLAFAFQNTSTSSNTKFPVSRFLCKDGDHLKLTRFFIQYAGQQRPTPDSDQSIELKENDLISAVVPSKNNLTQRWYETLINTNAMYNPGGVESFPRWLSLGPYYYFNWPKPPTDISTRVSLQYVMNNSDVCNILMFSRNNTAHLISLSNGRVVGVETQNIFGMVTPTMTTPAGPNSSGGPLAMSGGRMHYRY
jgi:hypothetical protein